MTAGNLGRCLLGGSFWVPRVACLPVLDGVAIAPSVKISLAFGSAFPIRTQNPELVFFLPLEQL